MAKLQQIQRLLLIIHKIQTEGYVPTDTLLEYVNDQMQKRSYEQSTSIRTLQRDINAIEELFGIDIKHIRPKGYFIKENLGGSAERYEELLLNFDLLSALNLDSELSSIIHLEHRKPMGGELIPIIIKAIKESNPIEFDYTNVRYDNSISHKVIEPYFLKESQRRWYLVGRDKGQVKLFALDRISNIEVATDTHFEADSTTDAHSMFNDCFGIWNNPDMPIEEVVLSYSSLDGSFIKRDPLHHSQRIIIDSDDEFRIQVTLRITNDFVMELLSRSNSLKVIVPESLRQRVVEIYGNALKRNQDE